MMDQQSKFKLQAYLDNELGAADSREVAAWLEEDAQARATHAELAEVRSILAGNELEVSVPESREFYWSKIERAIRQQSAQRSRSVFLPGYPWWVRLVAPALGAAMLLVVGMSLVRFGTGPGSVTYLHEIETPLAETSAISFHSQAAGMTVVWLESQGN